MLNTNPGALYCNRVENMLIKYSELNLVESNRRVLTVLPFGPVLSIKRIAFSRKLYRLLG